MGQESHEQESLRLRREREDERKRAEDMEENLHRAAEMGTLLMESSARADADKAQMQAEMDRLRERLEEANYHNHEVQSKCDKLTYHLEKAQLDSSEPEPAPSRPRSVTDQPIGCVSSEKPMKVGAAAERDSSTKLAAMTKEQARLKKEAKDLEIRSEQEAEA